MCVLDTSHQSDGDLLWKSPSSFTMTNPFQKVTKKSSHQKTGTKSGFFRKRMETESVLQKENGKLKCFSVKEWKAKCFSLCTFSPISVISPPGSTSRSGVKAQASRTQRYFGSLQSFPNRMLSRSVAFWIQACCGTYATEP